MRFELLEALSTPGRTVNEDLAGHTGNAAWVLDGAPGLGKRRFFPGPSDAAWLVAQADRSLRRLAPDPTLSLEDLFREVIEEVRDACETDRLAEIEQSLMDPSAAIVFLRLCDDRLECALLGDCQALLRLARTDRAFDGPTIDRLGLSGLERIDQMRMAGAISVAGFRDLLPDTLRRYRGSINQPGGSWLLGFDPEAAAHLDTFSFPASAGDEALLMSDGFYRLVDIFSACDGPQLLQAARQGGLAALERCLRAAETADPEGQRSRRLHIHDDATAMLLRIASG